MPTHRELMRIHVETLFTLDERGRMLRINEADGKEAPRFFLGRSADGSECWFRHDVAPDLMHALEAACRQDAGSDVLVPGYGSARYEGLLTRAAPVMRTWAGPAYVFPDHVAVEADAVPITERNADVLRAHFAAVRDLDRIPLYSTSWENHPSRALARRLGLVRFGSDLHVT